MSPGTFWGYRAQNLRERESSGRRAAPLLLVQEPGSLKFLAFNGLCHRLSWCSRNADQCFQRNTFLLNTVSTSGQNGTGFDNVPGSNNIEPYPQDEGDESPVKMVHLGVSGRRSEFGH